MPDNQRLKVLISAYACNPNLGSEEGVGWGWISAIAQYHDLWVITNEAHRDDIEAAVRESPDRWRNVSFHYVPRTRWKPLEVVWPPAYLWTYQHWLRDAFETAKALHRRVGFDLMHQLTYVGYRVPGRLWQIGVPFVWGPIGGLENTPWRFLPMLGLKGCLYYAARNTINSFQRRFLKAPKRAFRRARGGIIAATSGIQREIRRWYGEESQVVCEVGPFGKPVDAIRERREGEPLRLSWSGLHLPGKALPLLLHALCRLPGDLRWELDILGAGPCMEGWRKLAIQLGVDGTCRWHGQLPRDRAVEVMRQSHAFIITSVKDLTSTVILEAISQGIPVVCPDHCGFPDVITEDCGITIPAISRQQLVEDIAKAIIALDRDETRRRRLAQGALKRVGKFSWDSKGEAVDQIYRTVMQHWWHRDQSGPATREEMKS